MEPVVFDIGIDSGLFHKAVIFLGAVTGIGNACLRMFAVTVEKRVEEGYHGKGIAGSLKQSEVKDELILRSNLQIISRLCLAVVHGILFHPHERGVTVGLGI